MGFRINHIHLKSPDPKKTAEWYVKAFDFQIASDETRVFSRTGSAKCATYACRYLATASLTGSA